MSHNVYKVAIQMARTVPSLKEETGVTGYHILYGYSLLFQMDEKTLNLLFSEEERADIEKARKVLEENEICIAMQKQEYQLISIAGGGFVGKRRSTF